LSTTSAVGHFRPRWSLRLVR